MPSIGGGLERLTYCVEGVVIILYIYSSLIEGEALLLKTFSTSSVVVDFSPKNYIYLLNPALKRQPIIPHLISNRSKVDSGGE